MNYRNQKLLELARMLPCQLCNIEDGTVVASHSNQLTDGKGKGIKAHDYRIASLCYNCHYEIDSGKEYSKEERRNLWDYAHRKTIGEFFAKGYINT